jgi:hypothetical protein
MAESAPELPVFVMSEATAVAALPGARLPAAYETARLALRQCARVDECKDWADRAAALASYAKQAEDEELLKMARRIQVRAVDRCGEILGEIEAATNRHDVSSGRDAPTSKGRFAAGKEAGLSKDQAVTALRVHNVPRDEFEAAVESDNPPTVTALAERGKQSRPAKPLLDLGERTPAEFEAATQLIGAVDYFFRTVAPIELTLAVRGCRPEERTNLRTRAGELINWADKVRETLGEA